MKIYVDAHAAERPIGQHLAELLPGWEVAFERLDVGDFVVEAHGHRLVIERKSLPDLAASIADGRMAEQVDRMLQSSGTPVVLVTGSPPEVEGWVGGMRASALLGVLNRLQFAQGVVVVWAAAEDAARRIAQIASKLESSGFAPPPPTESTRPLKRARSGGTDDANAVKRAVLVGIPRVSPAVANALLARWPSVVQIGAQPPDVLASVGVGKRSVGPKLAETISKALA